MLATLWVGVQAVREMHPFALLLSCTTLFPVLLGCVDRILACIFDGFPNRSLFESLRDRHQEAGHAYRDDGAGLADRT